MRKVLAFIFFHVEKNELREDDPCPAVLRKPPYVETLRGTKGSRITQSGLLGF